MKIFCLSLGAIFGWLGLRRKSIKEGLCVYGFEDDGHKGVICATNF